MGLPKILLVCSGRLIRMLPAVSLFLRIKPKALLPPDDVKNGKVQKSFTVYNTGEHAIQVQFSASVLHQGTPESWEAVKNTEWYTIPAGQSQLLPMNVMRR